MKLVEEMLDKARERLVTLADGARLVEAAALLRQVDTHIIVLHDSDGLLTGVMTRWDVLGQVVQCHGAIGENTAATAMTRNVTVCQPGDQLDEVWSKMKAGDYKGVPVTDADNRPLGVLMARDVLQALLEASENEEAVLRDYVMGVGYR